MRIMSKKKDYYDFVAGHDTDPRKVFIRDDITEPIWAVGNKNGSFRTVYDSTHYYEGDKPIFIGCVWFCDKFYSYLLFQGAYYYGYNSVPQDILFEVNQIINNYRRTKYFYRRKKVEDYLKEHMEPWKSKWSDREREDFNKPLNRIFGQPIIFSLYKERTVQLSVNGILKEIDFSKVKSPAAAFTDIYNWIPYTEPAVPSDPTDMIRYEGKGFDKKTSFRH